MGGLPSLVTELREFIRRLNGVGELLREIRRRVEALEQGMRDVRPGRGLLSATLSGRVVGCNGVGIPDASVVVADAATGIVLAETTADDHGDYTVAVALGRIGQTLN